MSNIDPDTGDVWVVYDGECPFCSSYMQLYRIRARTQVHLIDARTSHPLVAEVKARRIDLDAGMAVRFNDRIYHGAEAMNLLAVLGSSDTAFNIANRILFRHKQLARLLYPVLVRGRLLTLRLLGRRLIAENQA
jgi:predicted DCC family thiol-disulfide oxidoreductase YuxK